MTRLFISRALARLHIREETHFAESSMKTRMSGSAAFNYQLGAAKRMIRTVYKPPSIGTVIQEERGERRDCCGQRRPQAKENEGR